MITYALIPGVYIDYRAIKRSSTAELIIEELSSGCFNFHLFRKPPGEIRVVIWEMALPRRRFPDHSYRFDGTVLRYPGLHDNSINIALSCREACEVVRSVYGIQPRIVERGKINWLVESEWEDELSWPIPKCSYKDDIFHISGTGWFSDFGFELSHNRTSGISVSIMEMKHVNGVGRRPDFFVWKLLPCLSLEELIFDKNSPQKPFGDGRFGSIENGQIMTDHPNISPFCTEYVGEKAGVGNRGWTKKSWKVKESIRDVTVKEGKGEYKRLRGIPFFFARFWRGEGFLGGGEAGAQSLSQA